MIVLVSLIVLLRGLPCFHSFSHGASLPRFQSVPHAINYAPLRSASGESLGSEAIAVL